MSTAPLLEGRFAVVTGGAAGIGGGVSRVLASEGAVVILNDIDPALAAANVATIEAAGGRAVSVIGDIRDREVVVRLRDTALEVGGGRIDVLVNNVGDFRYGNGLFLRSTEDGWLDQYRITLEHVLRCTQAFLPVMQEQRSGAIINNSTVEAIRGIPYNSVYSAMNAGVIAFTKSLAIEVGQYGVRVNCIAPDMADTLQTPAEAMLRGRDPELIKTWIPLGRFGEPDEYGRVVLFLASDLSSYVTGHVVPVDGGTMAASGWYGRYKKKGFTNLPDNP